MTVVHFPGHHWAHCRGDCTGCFLCHGGLGLCTRCGGLEGSLPTDCPGDLMHEEVEQAVYAGAVDYRAGEGWTARPSIIWEREDSA